MKLPKTITSSLAILTMVTGSHGLSNVLETEICESLAEQGKCETQPKVASEFCQKSCDDWYVAKGNSYYETFDVEVDDSDAFYELEAKSWTGDDIKFSKFDGFITCIANIGIICTPGEDEILSKNIDELRKEMPYTVELFIFPFSLNDDIKTSQDCKSMNKAISKKAKNLHIMDMITLNGDGSHDVFKHLKKIMGKKDDFKEDRSTFFFVNPVASRIDVLEGAQLSALRKHVKGHLNGWEDEM